MKTRQDWIDILKTIGIIFIVIGHTIKGTSFLVQYAYAFTVPLFFLTLGLTYRKKEKVFGTYLQKIKRILLPYLIFAVISVIIFLILGKITASSLNQSIDLDIKKNVLSIFYANSRNDSMKWNTPLWFLPCYFITFIIIDIFERITSQLDTRYSMRVVFIILTFVISFVYMRAFKNIYLPFQYESAVFMAGFAELGVIFMKLYPDIEIKIPKFVYPIVTVILLTAGFFMSKLNGYADARGFLVGKNYVLYISTSLVIITGLISLSIFIEKVSKYLKNALCYVGKRTLPILLMHKFPILLFQTVIPFTRDILTNNMASFTKTLTGIVISLISIILCLIVEHFVTPILPFIFGGEKKRKELRYKKDYPDQI